MKRRFRGAEEEINGGESRGIEGFRLKFRPLRNTIENYFSILKRGLVGVYQHVGPQHLKRYIGEFDFRYNYREITDAERRDVALMGIEGKRLTYRGTH